MAHIETGGAVQPLDLDAQLAKPNLKNFIYRVGIELEGGWTKVPEGVELARDGSITGLALPKAEILAIKAGAVPYYQLNIGELASEPMELKKFVPWMRQSYPSHVNETCGLHVHYSFRSALHYMWLMDTPAYQAAMQKYLTVWAEEADLPKAHPIWKRLRGENEFCAAKFYPDLQAMKKKKSYEHASEGNRYTIINYPHGLHGTMECRVLPMFEDVELGVKAVQRVLDVTNAAIAVCARREESIHGKFEVSPVDSRHVEETEEFV